MAKKKSKKAAIAVISAQQKAKINKALKSVEDKILTNYRSAAKSSGKAGKSISTETKKVKKHLAVAKKRIEVEVRKNPAGATVAAAVLGAIAGALLMNKLKKR
jgi:hypothetical protein